MSNSEDWVSHNLQRQRQILEEKQRQRRIQNNGIFSSGFDRPPTTTSANNSSPTVAVGSGYGIPRSSSSSSTMSVGQRSRGQDSTAAIRMAMGFDGGGGDLLSSSTANSRENSRGEGGGVAGRSENVSSMGTGSSLRNSLYSLSNAPSGGDSSSYGTAGVDRSLYHRPRRNTASTLQPDSIASPKIITVKGFTPPELRKQLSKNALIQVSKSGGQSSAFTQSTVPQKPIVNVDRLEHLTPSDSTRLINSENEDDPTTSYQTQLSRINAAIGATSLNAKPSSSAFSVKPPTAGLRHNDEGGSGGFGGGGLNARRRLEPWEEFDHRHPHHKNNAAANNHRHQLHNRQPTDEDGEDSATVEPVTDEEELESIPTEIVNEENPIGVADIVNNLDQFVMQPTRKNTTLKCKITRDKKGVDKGMFPIYYLHLEKVDGRRIFLLAARRRKKSTTANYLISTDPTDLSRNGRSFVAKIRSNAVGTSFTIYDKGENPKKASVIGEGIRQELAAVIYETNVLGLRGPRKMIVIIPGIYVDEKHNYVRPLTIRPISERDSILERYKTHRLDEMVVLNNKQPVWSEESQSYVLNFHGRVTQASVKNFQIVHSLSSVSGENSSAQNIQSSFIAEQNEYIVMQFGRIDNDNFTMDVRYPLSPVQAFGIAMTSFHKKLACD